MIRRPVFVLLAASIVSVTMLSCIQPVSNHYVSTMPVTPIIVEEPVEQEKPKEDIVIKPIPIYPAYLQNKYGQLWGVPSFLQGIMHREKIPIETIDGKSLSGISFFIDRGIAYITHKYMTDDGKEYTDYYAQNLSSNPPCIDLVDSIPSCPEMSRVTLDSPEWLIETSVISGTEWSYLYNRHDAVWGGYGKGEWICRKPSIRNYAVLDKGILVECDDGVWFCPSNRKSLNEVDGKEVRLWK